MNNLQKFGLFMFEKSFPSWICDLNSLATKLWKLMINLKAFWFNHVVKLMNLLALYPQLPQDSLQINTISEGNLLQSPLAAQYLHWENSSLHPWKWNKHHWQINVNTAHLLTTSPQMLHVFMQAIRMKS